MNLRRHARFYVAVLLGIAAFLLAGSLGGWQLRFLLAGNVFFLAYLVQTFVFVAEATVDHLRQRAAAADEGLPLILLATVAVVVVSLAAIFQLVRQDGTWLGATALAGLPLGWLTLHTLVAFHYANLFYAPKPGGGDAGGLDFPATPVPGPWDFLYFSFVIGMTAQVSDVAVTSTAMRRIALAHGVGAFFYNTVILALAVNAAVSYAS